MRPRGGWVPSGIVLLGGPHVFGGCNHPAVPAISVRDEDPPDDAIVVVRGGAMRSEFVRRTATDAHAEYGIYSISVFLALDVDVDELCRGEPYLSRYGQVRTSSVERVRVAGFALIPTLGRPHSDVVLPDLTDATLDRLDSCFDPPMPNPGRVG